MKPKLKTPVSYYGGKQSMLNEILPLLPERQIYVEPFFGGGAVFWAKEPVKVETINDVNGMVVNFYEQLKNNFDELKLLIDATPYSRVVYKKAMVIYEHPYVFTPSVKAWALWVATIQGFSNKIGSWRSSTLRSKEAGLNHNKKLAFTKELSKRLDIVQIENMDAVELIKRQDSSATFFYVDPPYVDSNQGHYGGYMQCHFDSLLETLSGIKGKFLLSSYPNAKLEEYTQKFGWNCKPVDKSLSASSTKGKRKTEMLTWNYLI